jgi:hypothetical protein
MTEDPKICDFVSLIIDLPQDSIECARKNLFIADLLRHPIVARYLDRSSNRQDDSEYLETFVRPIPSNCKEVNVVYQDRPENPNRDFSFKILVDNIQFPSDLTFTLRRDYQHYEEVYKKGELIIIA